MKNQRLSIGLDLSTQSLSAAILDIDRQEVVAEISLDYLKDPRLNRFGVRAPDYILPPRIEGEADQPPALFLSALDALFSDLRKSINTADIAVINASAQQHGHVYLNRKARAVFARLGKSGSEKSDLTYLLDGCLAYDRAPIWMTSNTAAEAEIIRAFTGGKEDLINLTGSDVQLRFTGPVIRNIAGRFPELYAKTTTIHLLSSLVTAVLTGSTDVPIDYGNACGMSLMNYRERAWDEVCIRAVARGLPSGPEGLRSRLPDLAAPDAPAGRICRYYLEKYGLSPDCLVAAGSGDNPQSKVLVSTDLLSLGTSLVYMSNMNSPSFDSTGAAAAMYDGIGRPFMFGCRTNGALVWDQIRALYGLGKDENAPAEQALQDTLPGKNMIFWQPRAESFPVSPALPLHRATGVIPGLGNDYAGCIESGLAAVYYHSRQFTSGKKTPLFITGGAAESPGIIRRIAAIWNRPVISLQHSGAALGAAVAGMSCLCKTEAVPFDIDAVTTNIAGRGREFKPVPGDVDAFHGPQGYLERFAAAERELFDRNI